MASGNADVAAAEAKVEVAKQEVAAAEAKVEAAKQEVAAAEEKLEAIEDQLCEGGLSEETRKVLEDRKSWAQRSLDGAQKGLDGAEDGLKIAWKGLDGAQDLLLRLQRATDAGTRATDCSLCLLPCCCGGGCGPLICSVSCAAVCPPGLPWGGAQIDAWWTRIICRPTLLCLLIHRICNCP